MSLTSIATDMISALGYGGLTVGLIVDSAGVPIPSEVLIPLAGALAAQGRFNILAVIFLGTMAQTAGAVLAYWLGKGAGLELVKRYGKYVFFSTHELEKTHALFERWGTGLTLLGRCIPGVRTYIGFPAGIAGMRFDVFAIASLVGSFVWTVFLALLGYYAAAHLELIDQALNRFGIVMLVLLVGAFVFYLKHKQKRRQAKQDATE
jgi:membrane protein DedA with SNARE-associated domain